MSRYIDADLVLELFKDVHPLDYNANAYVQQIKKLPTADVKPIVYGHWIWQTEDIYRCSECGNDIRVKEVMNIPQYVRCPMCEAKMVEPQKSEDKE